MADGSGGRGIFGRVLTFGGIAWIFWAVFGQVIALEFGSGALDLPLLPGLVILFLGRALTRARGGQEPVPQEPGSGSKQPTRPRPQARPRPVSVHRASQPVSASPERVETVEEVPEPYEETGDMPQPAEMPPRKTSAEMVEEARARYGRRP